ncbi:MAG TPA: 30S ribosomal protein S2, partial [Candidatus Saccharimonadales bacterium]|nr:30S ribosomal protein S2 [Candidatus Saccharimonadales bacterium]
MNPITIKDLLEAGAHFGHQTKRWNPKMKPFIFGRRNGIYIIDLQQTVSLFRKAADFVSGSVSRGGSILFVGTKRQAQETIREEADRAGMPYVNTRWLGGTLTNFPAIKRRIERFRWLEGMQAEEGRRQGYTKKELIGLDKERQKLAKVLTGLKDLTSVPSMIFVVDPSRERIAVTEARKLGITVVAIVDTNCDPTEADFPIPGNDDAIRAIKLFTSRIADAVTEGAGFAARRAEGPSEPPAPQADA